VPEIDVRGYLRRLGVADRGRPSAAALHRLHRAQVERVPYESLEIQLGRPTTVDPAESVRRILRGRGGYCFHLNGAFATLLAALGYAVGWHRGWVFTGEPDQPRGNPNHLALTVRGLPTRHCPDGVWFVDAGLGDALHEPLPLRAGVYRQGPFRYRMEASPVEPGGWRFVHDPAGSFTAMDFAPGPAGPADFADSHAELSGSPSSPFVRWAVVQRRHAGGVDSLTGCKLTHLGAGEPVSRILDTSAEWYGVLARVFGLDMSDVSARERGELWSRVRSAHEAAAHEQGWAA
jgi:N-hydroxyarylamine O-acetyltransferase